MNRNLLSCEGLCVDIAGRRLIDALSFAVTEGEFVALLGENGAGKTLLLHTLAGLRPPASGHISIQDRPLGRWPRRALAQKVALLTQTNEDPFPSTVLETALIGRHPHIDFWRWEESKDIELTRAALAAVGLEQLESRDVQTLSGGERRRLSIATVLNQDTPLFLVDEPENHLDPRHRVEALKLFRERVAAGRAVIASLHDASAAAQFADRALLLFGDGRWLYGACAEVLTADHLTQLYRTPVREIRTGERRIFWSE